MPPVRFASNRVTVAVLGVLTAVGPLGVDLHLPAFPQIAEDLRTSEAMVQVTLATYLVGLGVGQLVAGPLADRVGRRRPLVGGMVGYVGCSALCALAPSIEVLAVSRLAQGLAAAFVVVVTRAIGADLYEGAELARMLSQLMLVVGVVPMLAPVLGGQLVGPIGWRGLFWVLAALGSAFAVLAWRCVPETLPAGTRTGRDGARYRDLLRDRRFAGYLATATLAYLAILAYVAGAPFAYEAHGVDPGTFGLLFGLNAVGLTLCAQLNARLVRTAPPGRLLAIGAAIATAGAACVTITGSLGLVGLALPLLVVLCAHGLVLPNSTALAMGRHPRSAGAASALVGSVQFLISAAVIPLAGLVGAVSTAAMGTTIALAAAGITALAVALNRRR